MARLRFAGADTPAEIRQRHEEVQRAIGPDPRLADDLEELADPGAADSTYRAAMDRVKARVRAEGGHRLLDLENCNFGFARNLYGLKALGLMVSCLTLMATTAIGIWGLFSDRPSFAPFIFPLVVSLVALALWRRVTPEFVRRNAEAYADRLMEATRELPPKR
ncbi:hypothetical protein ACFUC1_03005 [Pedococcus sp. NPDC057267]|uniref:hypothetical protein n=1 Tax=Pedococcus sp. NPDC057267 TaxID=3346077 RepID=UPI00363C463F